MTHRFPGLYSLGAPIRTCASKFIWIKCVQVVACEVSLSVCQSDTGLGPPDTGYDVVILAFAHSEVAPCTSLFPPQAGLNFGVAKDPKGLPRGQSHLSVIIFIKGLRETIESRAMFSHDFEDASTSLDSRPLTSLSVT